jgi:hypothetical protein
LSTLNYNINLYQHFANSIYIPPSDRLTPHFVIYYESKFQSSSTFCALYPSLSTTPYFALYILICRNLHRHISRDGHPLRVHFNRSFTPLRIADDVFVRFFSHFSVLSKIRTSIRDYLFSLLTKPVSDTYKSTDSILFWKKKSA